MYHIEIRLHRNTYHIETMSQMMQVLEERPDYMKRENSN